MIRLEINDAKWLYRCAMLGLRIEFLQINLATDEN